MLPLHLLFLNICFSCIFMSYCLSVCTILLNLNVFFFVTVTFCGKGPSGTMYYMTKSMFDLFVDAPYPGALPFTFRDAFQLNDIWRYLQKPVLDGMYWSTNYDVQQSDVAADNFNIYYQNHIMGVPRLRQVCSANGFTIEQCFKNFFIAWNLKFQPPLLYMEQIHQWTISKTY